MKRPTVRDKLPSGELWQSLLRSLLVFTLSAARVGGLYAPWALAAVAVSGGKSRGLWALVGAAAGAVVWFDFQTGLRFAASAVLLYCANMAFCDTKLSRGDGYASILTATALGLVQAVYLVGRTASQWALCAAGCAVAAAVAYALGEKQRETALRPLALLTAAVPALLLTAVCGAGALCASLLREKPRAIQSAAFCVCALAIPLALDADRPWMTLYGSAAGAAAYLLMKRKWLPAAEEPKPEAAPAMAVNTAAKERAAAFQELYNTMFRTRPKEQGENPSVIFDQAARQACENCLLMKRCWHTEYNSTYNAFNDACGPMLKRGRAEAEDFPLFFTSRCLHFPELLSAINTELYAFRLRRQYRARLEDARRLAEVQYDQVSEALDEGVPPEPEGELPLRCRVGTLLRPKEGETQCGDQLAVFTAGAVLYMLLSDGMGSGPAAHAESAMTVRLLRQFLKAGIQPVSALKTINTALTLRCQEQGCFTTIDLLALDRRSGAARLYKYGAAASYVKKGGTVTRLDGTSLPAGLQSAHQPPETTGLSLEPGSVLVMVSDGVTSEGDEWLRELLRQWPGGDSQELAQMVMAESRRHGGLRDDCAALALRVEKSEENLEKRV